MQNTEDLVREIEIRKKHVHPENHDMVDRVFTYITYEAPFKNKEVMNLFIEILDHFLDAQKDGVTAESFFGDDPEQFAKDVLKELPSQSKEIKDLFLFFSLFSTGTILCVLSITGIPELFQHKVIKVNIASIILALAYYFIVLFSVTAIFLKKEKAQLFHENKRKNNLDLIYMIIAGILLGPIPYIIYNFAKIGPDIPAPVYITLPFGIIFLGLAGYFQKRS